MVFKIGVMMLLQMDCGAKREGEYQGECDVLLHGRLEFSSA